MKDGERIEQSRFGVTTRFVLGRDSFRHGIRDASGERGFDVPYETLMLRHTSQLAVNNQAYGMRLRLLAFVVLLAGAALTTRSETAGGAIMVAAIVAMVVLAICGQLRLFAVRFTLVPLNPMPPAAQGHPVRVINDGQEPALLAELERRWKARMRALHAAADPSEPAEQQLARLAWLRERAVLTTEEYEIEAARVRHAAGDGTAPDRRPLLN